MAKVKLKCLCGKVNGETCDINEHLGTRINCCCDDCQSFSQHLGHERNILDQFGGTDIFQMPISYLKITEGNDQIACVRLSSKGMYRWYTKCCNTPIGNTMGYGVPFIGVIHNFMDNASVRDKDLGKSRGYIQTKFAKEKIPENLQGSYFKISLRVIFKLLTWKMKGLGQPSVFFNANGKPIVKPNILN